MRRALTNKNVLAGLMFCSVAALGLWLSRDYPIGTALQMGTGYVPRLLCWVLLLLGGCIAIQGFREIEAERVAEARVLPIWRPVVFVTASLVIFGLGIERLGLIISILLMIGAGALAGRDLRPVETAIAAIVLAVLSWAVFILGLGLTMPIWPEW